MEQAAIPGTPESEAATEAAIEVAGAETEAEIDEAIA